LSRKPSNKIDISAYSKKVPENIPGAVQKATARFLGLRDQRISELENWQELRQAASDIRLHSLDKLDNYLELFEEKFVSSGGTLHWATDADEAQKIVLDIARTDQVKTAVKVKSMATEEIDLNKALSEGGIDVFETDLGEFIIQLANVGPSHIIVPAVHLKKEEIAELFNIRLGIDAPGDPLVLTQIARETLREKFLTADMGISGANFLVAETGTIVLVTNEGNGRMCTTIPDVHVAVVGIDKIIPDWSSLGILLQLLARSATGQKLSTYTSFITGPRRSNHENGPRKLHLILLDNGRSQLLSDAVGREVLKCIRCGSCLNVCPVYQSVGGYAYGWFISGPIGSIFTPQILGTDIAGQLPFASTLCGACVDVCPVKIPITKILLHLRHRVVEGANDDQASIPKVVRTGVRSMKWVFGSPWIYRTGSKVLTRLMPIVSYQGWIQRLPPPANRWTKVRPFPAFKARFREKWFKNRPRT
jgi:L-lactate dehydrogenase complex protein LldF